jgi:NADH-quinone oxidoreductase subunit F
MTPAKTIDVLKEYEWERIMVRLNSPAELDAFRQDLLAKRDPEKPVISICAGSGCVASGANEVIAAFKSEIESQGLAAKVDTKGTGCPGFCERGPIVVIYPEEICYLQVTPEDVPEILEQTIKENKVVERLLYEDPATGEKAVHESDISFYRNQERNLICHNIKIDSKSIDDYIANGGYSALAKVISGMTAEEVLQEVKTSNLRGRGGAGFPAGIKWEGSRNAADPIKYVIANADEGDPGAFMDRALLEGNPHSVLEGLIIGAYAVGAQEGYVYVRHEYPLAVENITLAIEQAEAYGLLGEGILGSDFSLKVFVNQGAGAFVCGESTALMTSLEGRAGEPRPKYVRSNLVGLWGRPSVLNNVETWANVPLIINKGADWFTQIGTEGSKGTKIFSLVGKITNTGLVEVPMGITLNDIIYKIGGGIPDGKKFKAVQTGGPSGGCIPEDKLDLQVGFDELTKAGSMMGSGGMIVLDEDTCMVDTARYFVKFLTEESCGKCVPCREGLRQMHKILTNITEGKGKEGDIELLESLSEVAQEASLCALGKGAPNPFLSTLKYFRDEYEAHIKEKRCPALSCKALIAFHIDPAACTGCMTCVKKCPAKAIDGGKKLISIIDQEKCTKCGTCFEVCPPRFNAVRKISGEPVPPPIPEEERKIARKGKQK